MIYEYPHGCITSLKDFITYQQLVTNHDYVPASADKLIKKCISRINKMLSLLLKHKTYSQHELVGEFMLIPTLDVNFFSTFIYITIC